MSSSSLPGFAATRLVVQGQGKLATKQIRRGGDGCLEKIDYSEGAKWWRMSPFAAADHGAMAVELEKLATMPRSLLVMGDCVPGLDLALEHRRRWAASEPLENTLRAVPRAWLAIDADDAPVPAPLGDAERLVEGAIHVRDRQLPPEFSNVTMLVSPTSSSGLRGPTLFRGRLWFLLDRPIPLADLRAWAMGVRAMGGPVDPAVMQAGQPIFTARPQFVGMDDPIPPHLLATVVSGVRDRVDLNADRYAVKVADIERRLQSVVACTGLDWRSFLSRTLGGELSFHEPLKMGLGRAARSGETDEAIIAFTWLLLAKCADPARRAPIQRGLDRPHLEELPREGWPHPQPPRGGPRLSFRGLIMPAPIELASGIPAADVPREIRQLVKAIRAAGGGPSPSSRSRCAWD